MLSPDDEIALRLIGSLDQTVLMLDGQEHVPLEPDDEIRIRLDPSAVRVVRNPARPFAHSLQVKLGWQGSTRRSM